MRGARFSYNSQLRRGAPSSSSFRNRRPARRSFNDISRFVNKAEVFQEEDEYVSKNTFANFKFTEKLQSNIDRHGYVTPTPIQDQSISHAMEGRDVLGIANTGTGKTAAFLLPLIDKVLKNRAENILIIAPTRELVAQINDEFRIFAAGTNIFSVMCIGGASMNMQMQNLRRPYNFVVATPGRLKDLIQRKSINPTRFQNVVLDEVDQMFDMGFVKDVQMILSLLPKVRQSLFYSATLSREVDTLVKASMQSPVVVSLKQRDTAATVDQDVVRIGNGKNKVDILHDLLVSDGFHKVLIFGKTKRGVSKLTEVLDERGFRVDSIHGDKTQYARQQALNKFKQDRIEILVATDVAARGIDIPNVSHVINYELPETYEDYIHRIGRTGRANKMGKALTFVEH